jgi:hypothetical protein
MRTKQKAAAHVKAVARAFDEGRRGKRASRFRPGESGAEAKELNRLRWRVRRRIKSNG